MVLLGDPGAGKSALTRFVLLQLLAEAPQAGSPLAALHGHLPLLIELRDFVVTQDRHRATDLLSYLGYLGETLNFGFTADAIREHLSRAPTLLIIDGLDEIFDHYDREQMVEQIVGLALRYQNLRLVLTARIAGFNEQKLRDAGFSVATLTDLSPDQVTAFAQQWFGVNFPLDPASADQARDRLLLAVQGRPQLRVLAGNPMLLTIMASMARSQPLARSRTALYAQVLDLLCFHWDDNRLLAPPPDSPLRDLTKDDALLMLRRIAWRMQESGEGLRANAMDEADLLRVLEQFFRDVWHFDPPKAARAAREMEDRLQDRNWVVTRRGPRLYGFVHRTFLEYLCATQIAEQFKAQRIDVERLVAEHVVPRLDDDTWHEVLRLLVGLLPDEATDAIGRVIGAMLPGEAEVAGQGLRLGLAWQALAELKPQVVPNLAALCVDLTDRLYQWLRRPGLGAGAGTYREQLRICRAVTGMIAEAAESLGTAAWLAPHPPARPWPVLASGDFGPLWFFFLEPTTQLVAGLGKTVWGCAAASNEWLRARTVDDPYADARRAALAALGQHFRDDPRTAELLRARAVDDPDAGARGAALDALGRHFRDDPRTAELLRARVVDDPAASARGAALAALGQHFRDDPRTAELLRARAVDDPDGVTRGAALAALGRHFRDDPRTAELLRARAVDDPNAEARGGALAALGQHFRDDARTAELLRARAVDDPHVDARGAALAALVQHFRDDARTAGLLHARAVDDPGGPARGAALDALGQYFRDDPRTAELLRARAVDDPAADARGIALGALGQHFRDDPRTAELLRARAVDDPDEYARRAALAALMQHFRDDARTAELLRARAVDDPAADARGIALGALGQHFRDDARTAELLRDRAVDDPDAYARRAALAALGQHFRDDPRTAELLRARAVDDPDGVTRGAALAALGRHFRDDPRTAELLRARAVDDPDASARGAALAALGQHFRDDPRTVELLRARAVDDPLGYVRGAALLALAPSLGVEDAAVLCSQDLDGFDPGLDPREPVTAAMVAKAAARLHLPEATIRDRYEQLARGAPLTLAWQTRRRGRGR